MSEQFELQIEMSVYKSDISLPVNTTLNISVHSYGFYANTTMDIDIKNLIVFARELLQLYTTLSGTAKLEEPYGNSFIEFLAETGGHIAIKGQLNKQYLNFSHKLWFENEIDQTYLCDFVASILDECNEYFC